MVLVAEMMMSHKFIYGSNNASVYQQVVFCEYCGHVAFTTKGGNPDNQAVAKKPCPLAPLAKTELNECLIGKSILDEIISPDLPKDWYNFHHKDCGTKYRDCHPELCPKDQYEKTGTWYPTLLGILGDVRK